MRATQLLARTIELVNAGVDQDRAVITLLDAGATATDVRAAQNILLESLSRNPFVDPTGIRAGRLLWAVLDAADDLVKTPSLGRAACPPGWTPQRANSLQWGPDSGPHCSENGLRPGLRPSDPPAL